MDRRGGWGGRITHISPVSDLCLHRSKGKTYRILNEICLLPSGRLGNGLSASMPIGLLTETVKTAMTVPVPTDPEVESDMEIYGFRLNINRPNNTLWRFIIAFFNFFVFFRGMRANFRTFCVRLVSFTERDFQTFRGLNGDCVARHCGRLWSSVDLIPLAPRAG